MIFIIIIKVFKLSKYFFLKLITLINLMGQILKSKIYLIIC